MAISHPGEMIHDVLSRFWLADWLHNGDAFARSLAVSNHINGKTHDLGSLVDYAFIWR